jgi:D-3-phosphoglycerate dehydrogenase
MKDGGNNVNCARGVIDEAVLKSLDRKCCRIGRFENEPTPEMTILMHHKITHTHMPSYRRSTR